MERKNPPLSDSSGGEGEGRDDTSPGVVSSKPSRTSNRRRIRLVDIADSRARGLRQPGEDPEQATMRAEATPENAQRAKRDEVQGAMEERVRLLIEEELKALTYRQKGVLAVHWVEDCGEEPDEVARALYLNPETTALRVTMCRARKAHPCGEEPGSCGRATDCAHARGEQLWNEIKHRVASKLK